MKSTRAAAAAAVANPRRSAKKSAGASSNSKAARKRQPAAAEPSHTLDKDGFESVGTGGKRGSRLDFQRRIEKMMPKIKVDPENIKEGEARCPDCKFKNKKSRGCKLMTCLMTLLHRDGKFVYYCAYCKQVTKDGILRGCPPTCPDWFHFEHRLAYCQVIHDVDEDEDTSTPIVSRASTLSPSSFASNSDEMDSNRYSNGINSYNTVMTTSEADLNEDEDVDVANEVPTSSDSSVSARAIELGPDAVTSTTHDRYSNGTNSYNTMMTTSEADLNEDEDVANEVPTSCILREKESKTYRKRFKLFLINFWECALRVESSNTFDKAQPQHVLHDELSKDIEQIAKNHTRRNEKKGAKYLQGDEILKMIHVHEPILREMDEGQGESESKFGEGGESVWVIPIKAYEEVVKWLHTIGEVERLISKKDRDFAQAEGERAFKNKYEGTSTGAKELQRVPVRLRNQLTSWQRDGVAFCVDRDGVCLLGDQMGLGKTIQSIASMSAFKEDWPLLIICPAIATTNWKAELLKWLKENKNSKKDDGTLVLNDHNIVMLTNGNDVIETHLKSEYKHVFIASFDRATTLVKNNKLQAGMFRAVIIDESHNLKSEAISQIVTEAKRRILLSGTPALSDPKELHSQISLLEANKNEIGNSSLMTHIDNGWKNADDLEQLLNASEFSTKVKMRMKRWLKEDVTKLTPKTREFVLINTECKDIESSAQSFLKNSKGRLARIMKEAAESDDNEIVSTESKSTLVEMRLNTGMAKVPRVLEELKGFINNEHNKKMKLCIFAHHQNVLDALEVSVDSNISIRIDGRVNTSERQKRVDLFQNNSAIRVALLSIQATGVAITLTASSTVWFAELGWTPASLLQAEDRCHRFGQCQPVTCRYFIAANSIDIPMVELIKQKFQDIAEYVVSKDKTIEFKGDSITKPKAEHTHTSTQSGVLEAVTEVGTLVQPIDAESKSSGCGPDDPHCKTLPALALNQATTGEKTDIQLICNQIYKLWPRKKHGVMSSELKVALLKLLIPQNKDKDTRAYNVADVAAFIRLTVFPTESMGNKSPYKDVKLNAILGLHYFRLQHLKNPRLSASRLSDQLQKRQSPLQSSQTPEPKPKRAKRKSTCFVLNCKTVSVECGLCIEHLKTKDNYICSYGKCSFRISDWKDSRCQNHIGFPNIKTSNEE